MDAYLQCLTEHYLQIASGGIQKATIPACIENGDYLLRFEMLALHSAYSQRGAQFYVRPNTIMQSHIADTSIADGMCPNSCHWRYGNWQARHRVLARCLFGMTVPTGERVSCLN